MAETTFLEQAAASGIWGMSIIYAADPWIKSKLRRKSPKETSPALILELEP